MTNNDQAAAQTVSPAKQGWVKPEITSFAPAVEAQANSGTGSDAGAAGNNLS